MSPYSSRSETPLVVLVGVLAAAPPALLVPTPLAAVVSRRSALTCAADVVLAARSQSFESKYFNRSELVPSMSQLGQKYSYSGGPVRPRQERW